MRLHVCTHYSLTLQGTTMFSWKFIAHNYQSSVTYIFLTHFQEASFVCCLLTSHSPPAPLLDWRHIYKQISPKLPSFLHRSDGILKNEITRNFTSWTAHNHPCLSDGTAVPSDSTWEGQGSNSWMIFENSSRPRFGKHRTRCWISVLPLRSLKWYPGSRRQAGKRTSFYLERQE